MSAYKFHKIWIEQCEAATAIKERFGAQSAFDYLVGEKLVNFTEAAADRAEFARELPAFVATIRCVFEPEEMRGHFKAVEHRLRLSRRSTLKRSSKARAGASEETVRLATIKQLLVVDQLGVS